MSFKDRTGFKARGKLSSSIRLCKYLSTLTREFGAIISTVWGSRRGSKYFLLTSWHRDAPQSVTFSLRKRLLQKMALKINQRASVHPKLTKPQSTTVDRSFAMLSSQVKSGHWVAFYLYEPFPFESSIEIGQKLI